jgi:hypothetical protein
MAVLCEDRLILLSLGFKRLNMAAGCIVSVWTQNEPAIRKWNNLLDYEIIKFQSFLNVHESVQSDMILKVTNKMQLYRLIYYS